jgi:hypothetical protein
MLRPALLVAVTVACTITSEISFCRCSFTDSHPIVVKFVCCGLLSYLHGIDGEQSPALPDQPAPPRYTPQCHSQRPRSRPSMHPHDSILTETTSLQSKRLQQYHTPHPAHHWCRHADCHHLHHRCTDQPSDVPSAHGGVKKIKPCSSSMFGLENTTTVESSAAKFVELVQALPVPSIAHHCGLSTLQFGQSSLAYTSVEPCLSLSPPPPPLRPLLSLSRLPPLPPAMHMHAVSSPLIRD